jgi:hypothetical protein
MPEYVLDLERLEVYEAGAILVTLLAYPGVSDTCATRGRVHRMLCAGSLLARRETDPEWAAAPQRIKPNYAFVSEQAIERNLRTLERRLRDRMAAARMVIPFLLEAQTGLEPELPPDVKRLSLNQLAELVLSDVGQSESQNVKNRIWRPSVPVIHLAAAIAVRGQDILRMTGRPLDHSSLLQTQGIIEWVIRTAQEYEALITQSQRLHIDPECLIRLRLA